MRSDRRSKSIPALAEHLEDMATIVEHKRANSPSDRAKKEGRRVREAVAVVVFEEEDGTETVSVIGDSQIPALELKGVLHDGLYAMAHEGEQDYTPE